MSLIIYGTNTMKKPTNETKIVSHYTYLQAKDKGLLRNGRSKVGGVVGNRKSKAYKNKRKCRQKIRFSR